MYKNTLSGLILLLSTALVASCSTDSTNPSSHRSSGSNLVASPTPVIYTPTNVKIYDADKAPTQPTTEISVVQVDLYNQYGIKRQKAEVNEMLKAQACSVGGNALILIDNSDTKHCYAEVVQIDPKVASTSNNAAPSTSTSATTPISATK